MTKIPIDNQKYDLPTAWDEVSYSQHVALLKVGDSLSGFLNLFTKISIESLLKTEMDCFRAWEILSFLNTPPQYKPKPTSKVGKYRVKDVTRITLGQYDDLKELLTKAPASVKSVDDNLQLCDNYLEACAIITAADQSKIQEVKEDLKNCCCVEVLQTGAFFLFWVLKAQQPNQLN